MAKKRKGSTASASPNTGTQSSGGRSGATTSASTTNPQTTTVTAKQESQLRKAQKRVESQDARTKRAKKRVREAAKAAKTGKATKREKKVLREALAILDKRKEKLGGFRDKRNELRNYEIHTPGVENPDTPPFKLAEDFLAEDQARAERTDTYTTLDEQLASMAAQNVSEKQRIAKDQAYSRRDAEFLAASRGLERSSIRDAELWDIDATAGLRRNELDTNLQLATLSADRQKTAADNAWNDFQRNYLGPKMVENAAAADEGVPEYAVDPTTEKAKLDIPRTQGKGKGGNGAGVLSVTPNAQRNRNKNAAQRQMKAVIGG